MLNSGCIFTYILLSLHICHTVVRSASSHLSLSLCRCDPHSRADCTRRSGRGGEESLEVVLQEQPERSHQECGTFCGENKVMMEAGDGQTGWMDGWMEGRNLRD